jgi:hypothetical protein
MIRGLVRRLLSPVKPRKVAGREEFKDIVSVKFYCCVSVPSEAMAEIKYADGRVEYVEVHAVSIYPGSPDYPLVRSDALDRTVVYDNPSPMFCRMRAWTEPISALRDLWELRVSVECTKPGMGR